MLVLTRRMNEKIIIDDRITVTILSSEGKNIRVGIDAPKEVSVHREEIYKKIKANEVKCA
jgi:carbon storage regulator